MLHVLLLHVCRSVAPNTEHQALLAVCHISPCRGRRPEPVLCWMRNLQPGSGWPLLPVSCALRMHVQTSLWRCRNALGLRVCSAGRHACQHAHPAVLFRWQNVSPGVDDCDKDACTAPGEDVVVVLHLRPRKSFSSLPQSLTQSRHTPLCTATARPYHSTTAHRCTAALPPQPHAFHSTQSTFTRGRRARAARRPAHQQLTAHQLPDCCLRWTHQQSPTARTHGLPDCCQDLVVNAEVDVLVLPA